MQLQTTYPERDLSVASQPSFLKKRTDSAFNILTMYTLYILKENNQAYGKQILDQIRQWINNHSWKLSHGTLYPLLDQMQKEGYIQRVDGDRFRNRKYYTITKKGEFFFHQHYQDFVASLARSSQSYQNLTLEIH